MLAGIRSPGVDNQDGRTLSCGHTGGFKVIEDPNEQGLEGFYSGFYAYIHRLLGHATAIRSLTVDPRDLYSGQGNWQDYKMAAARMCAKRRFFRTGRGGYGL